MLLIENKEKKLLGISMVEFAENKSGKRICPFIDDPSDDCYIVTLDSLKVESAIYYCGGNFEECHIYRKLRGGPVG